MERFPCGKRLFGSNDHINQHTVSLSLHQLGRTSESIDCEISLRHLPSRPFHFFQVDASLDRAHPQDIFASNHFESSVCPSDRLIYSPSCARRSGSEAGMNGENYSYVSDNLLLIVDY